MFKRALLLAGLVQSCTAMEAFYTLNFDRLEAANEALKATQLEIAINKFQHCTSHAKRTPLTEEHVSSKKLIYAKEFARSVRENDKTLPVSQAQTVEEVHNIVLKYFFESRPASLTQEQAEEKLRSYFETVDSYIENKLEEARLHVQSFNNYIESLGPWRDWLFKDFVNNLLGIQQDSTLQDLESKQKVIDALKQSGFLKLNFDFPIKDFEYNPAFAVLHFMEHHPTVSSLVLGCGHHLPRVMTDALGVFEESICGTCQDPDHHNHDLTISLIASDLPDVVSDLHNPEIWSVLKDKPGGWKKIVDHSWGESLLKPATLKQIFACLSPDGIFEVWDIGAEAAIKYALPIGFVFHSFDEKTKTVSFKKI